MKYVLVLLSLAVLLLCVGCSTDPATQESLESPESTVSVPEELVGIWVSATAGERNMVETITFSADGSLSVKLDYEGSEYATLYGSFYVDGHSVVCHISEGTSPYDVTYEYRVDGRELYLTDDDGEAHYLRNS